MEPLLLPWSSCSCIVVAFVESNVQGKKRKDRKRKGDEVICLALARNFIFGALRIRHEI